MRLIVKIFLSAWLLISLVSCENYTVYHAYKHIARQEWQKGDTLDLSVTIADTIPGNYRIVILVRNTIDYKYQKLPLVILHNFPDTAVWRTDTLIYKVTDEKGNWKGKGIGGLYELVHDLDSARLSLPQSFSFNVSFSMNDSVLTGINDIGIIARKRK